MASNDSELQDYRLMCSPGMVVILQPAERSETGEIFVSGLRIDSARNKSGNPILGGTSGRGDGLPTKASSGWRLTQVGRVEREGRGK